MIDLEKLKNLLEPRFSKIEILKGTGGQDDDFDLIEIHNISLPKHIYVNSKGEIWTSASDLQEASSTNDAVKKVKELTAGQKASAIPVYVQATDEIDSYRHVRDIVSLASQVFKVAELREVVAHCGCAVDCGNGCHAAMVPALSEAQVQFQGDEIVNDLLTEPEITGLGLSPEDQDEVVVMVFDDVIASKEEKLAQADVILAPKVAAFLDKQFENIRFSHLRDDQIEVYFDAKLATGPVSKEAFTEFLRTATQDMEIQKFFVSIAKDFSSKVSSAVPDYFLLRNTVVSEVLEQVKEASLKRVSRIIGKTTSGKPVYDKFDHPAHKGFSQQDHWDAAGFHMPGKGQTADLAECKKHDEAAHKSELYDESGDLI